MGDDFSVLSIMKSYIIGYPWFLLFWIWGIFIYFFFLVFVYFLCFYPRNCHHVLTYRAMHEECWLFWLIMKVNGRSDQMVCIHILLHISIC